MFLELDGPIAYPGSSVHGRVKCDEAAYVRLRGESTTYRPIESERGDGEPARWLAESEVLLWREEPLASAEAEFHIELPKDCLPSACGQRFRVGYLLDLYDANGGVLESLELHVGRRPPEANPSRRVGLGPLDVSSDRPSRASARAPEEMLEALQPRGWVDKILEGRNRMDRILERAVRGKLVEPEELLAMQATMYGYSKGLSQIPPAPEETQPEGTLVPEASAFVVERDWHTPGQSIEVRVELGPQTRLLHAVVELTQSEASNCQGVETRMEQRIARTNTSGPEGSRLELRLPRSAAPSVRGRGLELAYLLTVTVQTDCGALQGRVPIGVATGSAQA